MMKHYISDIKKQAEKVATAITGAEMREAVSSAFSDTATALETIWHHNSIYVHAINEETKESVIVEKATLEVVKSPGALAGDPGHKNNISSSL